MKNGDFPLLCKRSPEGIIIGVRVAMGSPYRSAINHHRSVQSLGAGGHGIYMSFWMESQWATNGAGWWFGTFFIIPYIGKFIIPTDFHRFFRGVAQPQTRSHIIFSTRHEVFLCTPTREFPNYLDQNGKREINQQTGTRRFVRIWYVSGWMWDKTWPGPGNHECKGEIIHNCHNHPFDSPKSDVCCIWLITKFPEFLIRTFLTELHNCQSKRHHVLTLIRKY